MATLLKFRVGLLLLWKYSNCPSRSLCFHPLFEHLNPAPACIDTQCHGTRLKQLWMEDGLRCPVVSRLSWWPLCHHILLCVCVCMCALWHYGLCLFDIAALCSSLVVAKTMDIVSAATKRSSFFRPLKPELTTISHPPGDAWRRRAGPGASSVGRSIAAFTYGWSQRREACYTVAIPCRQHCTSLAGTGIFLVAGE